MPPLSLATATGRSPAATRYIDRANEALRAVGLSEYDADADSSGDTARAMSQQNVDLIYRGFDTFQPA